MARATSTWKGIGIIRGINLWIVRRAGIVIVCRKSVWTFWNDNIGILWGHHTWRDREGNVPSNRANHALCYQVATVQFGEARVSNGPTPNRSR